MPIPNDEKPQVHVVNESLTDAHPTGYVPHDACFDLDKAQLVTINPENTDAYNESKNRVESDEESSGIDGAEPNAWTETEGQGLTDYTRVYDPETNTVAPAPAESVE
jgi:hypothetical protein